MHKCHGGTDSLVTSREAYEIAMRFFHGTHSIRLSLDDARINGDEKDFFGRSEFFFGVTVKPRFVDFSLFEQSAAAENCYGPFRTVDLSDDGPGALPTALSQPLAASDRAMGWAGDGRLIWEGWIDSNANPKAPDMVFRLDVYVAERDTLGIGFSDNVIFAGQYWLQVIKGAHPVIFIHTTEQTLKLTSGLTEADADTVIDPRISRATEDATPENSAAAGWTFPVGGPELRGDAAPRGRRVGPGRVGHPCRIRRRRPFGARECAPFGRCGHARRTDNFVTMPTGGIISMRSLRIPVLTATVALLGGLLAPVPAAVADDLATDAAVHVVGTLVVIQAEESPTPVTSPQAAVDAAPTLGRTCSCPTVPPCRSTETSSPRMRPPAHPSTSSPRPAPTCSPTPASRHPEPSQQTPPRASRSSRPLSSPTTP